MAGIAALLLLLTLSTCRQSPPAPSTEGEPEADYTVSTPEQCERMLENLLDGLAPGRFGITSDQRTLVDTLNNWLAQCADPQSFSVSEGDAALRERLLPADVLELTNRERFNDQDAAYFRNVMLVRDIMDSTLTGEETDLERAVALFYGIVTTVDLRMPGAGDLPFGPYEMSLFGSGTAADRAWLFGLMLRQLRLDAVVIRPRSADPNETGAFLIGVIIPEEGVYLFDSQLGLPITSPSDDSRTPLPRQPIEFAAALEDDHVFRQYDIRGTKYPITSEQLTDVEVFAIGESSTWSPRFGLLQVASPESLELYDGLAASSLREYGLIERLVRAGGDTRWAEADVAVWDYPEQVYRRAANMSDAHREQLTFLASVMEAPLKVTFEQQGEQVVPRIEPSDENLHQARIHHLRGKYSPALDVYLRTRLSVQHLGNQPVIPNYYGLDWSTYWVALAQYLQEDYVAAAQSAERYLKIPRDWTTAAQTLLAKCLAQQGQFAEAAAILNKQAFRSPQRLGNQWLVGRWQRLAESGDPANQLADEPEEIDAPPTRPQDSPQPAASGGERPVSDPLPPRTPQDLPDGEEPPDPRFDEDGAAALHPARGGHVVVCVLADRFGNPDTFNGTGRGRFRSQSPRAV